MLLSACDQHALLASILEDTVPDLPLRPPGEHPGEVVVGLVRPVVAYDVAATRNRQQVVELAHEDAEIEAQHLAGGVAEGACYA